MSEPSTRGRQWTSGRSGEGGRTVVTIAPSPRTGFVTTGRRWVRSAQWFGVPVRDVVRARRGGRVRVLERVVDAVEHQENVRARERRDVVARTVHDVRVEPQGGAGRSGELIDAVAVGHVGNDLLGGHPIFCSFREDLWLSSGVSPRLGTKVRCEPGITISPPLYGKFGVSAIEQLTARGAGMPSSACQVSKSECQ